MKDGLKLAEGKIFTLEEKVNKMDAIFTVIIYADRGQRSSPIKTVTDIQKVRRRMMMRDVFNGNSGIHVIVDGRLLTMVLLGVTINPFCFFGRNIFPIAIL